jgi:hypothetical protein
MAPASLALLKGKPKPAAAAEGAANATKPAAPAAAAPKANVTPIKPAAPAAKPAAAAAAPKPKAAPKPAPAAAAPAAKPAAEPVAEVTEETVSINIDTMDGPALDALVKEHEIQVPKNWLKLNADQKRAWLKEQFEETPAEGAAETEAAAETVANPNPPEPVSQTAPAPKAGKGKAKAGTAVSTDVVHHGEIVGPDELNDVVHLVENLKEKDAKALVGTLAESAEFTFFKLGGVLSIIQANGWFAPHASFREYVENEHGINYRRAVYWVGIYNDLSESKVPWDKVKNLGWSKLKEIAGLLTPENVDAWVEAAMGQTVMQLVETVAKSKQPETAALTDQSQPAAPSQTTTRTFKVHPDQKKTIDEALKKAKQVSGTSDDTPALEYICLDYISGGGTPLPDQLKAIGLEKTLAALEAAYPDVSFNVEMTETASTE